MSYPVLNHTVIVEELAGVLLPVSDRDSDTSFTATLTTDQFPDLAYNMTYTVHIIACSSITCRQSEGVKVCKYIPLLHNILNTYMYRHNFSSSFLDLLVL